MALRFVDSFDHYDTAHAGQKWTGTGLGNAGSGILAAAARSGGQGLRLTPSGGSGGWISKSIDAQSKWTVGFAFRTSNLAQFLNNTASVWAYYTPLLTWTDGSIGQVQFNIDANGFINAWIFTGAYNPWTYGSFSGVTASSAGKASQPLTPNVWQFIELQTIFSATAGQMKIRVNGVPVFASGANLNTAPSGAARADGFSLLRYAVYQSVPGSGNTTDFDDLYVADGNGTVNNDFLGDVKVVALLPNGAGAATQFALTGAASNYAAVNESPPNDDTSYVSSGTAGQQDLYTIPAPSGASGSVAGVQVNLWARKDDAGVRTIEPLVRTGTTTAAGPQVNPGTTYQDLAVVLETNPANANAAFTFAELATDQFGVQEVA